MKLFLRLCKNPLSLTGLVLLTFFVGVAIAAPWLAPPPGRVSLIASRVVGLALFLSRPG